MVRKYRTADERRGIIRAIIGEGGVPDLASFNLSKSEEVYYRARAMRAVEDLTKASSSFKAYYALPVARPFRTVVSISGTIIAAATILAAFLYNYRPADNDGTTIVQVWVGVIIAAVGWSVTTGVTHRNTIRQNTNNLLFARFSHAAFGEALHRFYQAFGDVGSITPEMLADLRASGKAEDRQTTSAVSYILNYYEFVAAGVLNGDLNADIIRTNIRGIIVYFYDRCEPHILALVRKNPKTFENLVKLRTHYREP